jgi:hypothetical protein
MGATKGEQDGAGKARAYTNGRERNRKDTLTMFNIVAMFNYYEIQQKSERAIASG